METHQRTRSSDVLVAGTLAIFIVSVLVAGAFAVFERHYRGKIYPTVSVGNIPFGGKTSKDVEAYWNSKSEPFRTATFTFSFGKEVATISGAELDTGYDATLSGRQAYLVGRSGNIASDLFVKFLAPAVNLTPYFRWNEGAIDETLTRLGKGINVPVQDALFQFSNGKVTAFRPSHDGKQINIKETKNRFSELLTTIPNSPDRHITIPIAVDTIKPAFTTDRVNSFGIKERIGRGYSEFAGSIPGRVHNVALAAARLNGVLIKPGDTFSFNDTLGDVSNSTGFQPAYVIKEGRTVLGDGGGVCQVSTTLFRAVLDAGLPIVARTAHAYRVHYYEEGGYKPGLDATVFAPSVDLKFKNDTPGYILIQTKTDTNNLTLTFELYGTSDGRHAEIVNHQVWGITPPPPDLYQDDPTLPKGTVKQVDFSAWGAKASFQYRVTRNGQTLQDITVYSNFQPWQAVFLRGTQ